MPINCQIVRNEHGMFLVFEDEYSMEEAKELFSGWICVECFGAYNNALRLSNEESS